MTPVDLRAGAVSIGGRPVLRGIDLQVAAGAFVAVLGPNGSGKSTLVRALTGLRPLSHGTLRLFGTPVAQFRDWRRIGFVPQRSTAESGVPASVWETVAAGRLSRRRLLRPASAADRRAVGEALELVGLAGRARDGVSTLSGGQQQRVLIARALAGEPDLFLLDEPTAGVDATHQQSLAEALRALRDRGTTVLLVAHELGPLAPLVDRAVVMRHGRTAYDGPLTDDLVTGFGHLHPLHHEHHRHHHDTRPHAHAPHVGSSLGSSPGGRR